MKNIIMSSWASEIILKSYDVYALGNQVSLQIQSWCFTSTRYSYNKCFSIYTVSKGVGGCTSTVSIRNKHYIRRTKED